MSTNEQWREAVGHPGYEVSSNGRVRTVARTISRKNGTTLQIQGRIKKAYLCKRGGYPTIQLHHYGKRKLVSVHSLVAAAFIGPRPKGSDVCHADGNPTNNFVSNLRYGSRSENIQDTRAHGRLLIGEAHPSSKLNEATVLRIRELRANGLSYSRIAAVVGQKKHMVAHVIRRTSWAHI